MQAALILDGIRCCLTSPGGGPIAKVDAVFYLRRVSRPAGAAWIETNKRHQSDCVISTIVDDHQQFNFGPPLDLLAEGLFIASPGGGVDAVGRHITTKVNMLIFNPLQFLASSSLQFAETQRVKATFFLWRSQKQIFLYFNALFNPHGVRCCISADNAGKC